MASSLGQAPASPSSSPRLPSPPPFPEVQTAPKSPITPGDVMSDEPNKVAAQDHGASRRIRPGTKAAEMAAGPPLVPLNELDSPFQLQEHLKSLYLQTTRTPSGEHTIPITKTTALSLAQPPDGVDRALWLYELCRLLVQRANSLIVGFFADTPPCSAANCPEMRASEWQYLCAVHDPPKSCCAIDYCCHTLDWAANMLTSQKHFPSRLALGNIDGQGQQQQAGGLAAGGSGHAAGMRQLTNIFRRVYRMFAHAWFQHREVFWTLEGQEGLYIFYKTVCDVYQLIPEDNYTVPAEAEAGAPPEVGRKSSVMPVQTDAPAADEAPKDPAASTTNGTDAEAAASAAALAAAAAAAVETRSGSSPPPLERPQPQRQSSLVGADGADGTPPSSATAEDSLAAPSQPPRKHRASPSTGAFVAPIAEGDEEVKDDAAGNSSSKAFEKQEDTTSFLSTVRRDPSPVKKAAAVAAQAVAEPVKEAAEKVEALLKGGESEAPSAGADAAAAEKEVEAPAAEKKEEPVVPAEVPAVALAAETPAAEAPASAVADDAAPPAANEPIPTAETTVVVPEVTVVADDKPTEGEVKAEAAEVVKKEEAEGEKPPAASEEIKTE